MSQCEGRTQRDDRCGLAARPGEKYCVWHGEDGYVAAGKRLSDEEVHSIRKMLGVREEDIGR